MPEILEVAILQCQAAPAYAQSFGPLLPDAPPKAVINQVFLTEYNP